MVLLPWVKWWEGPQKLLRSIKMAHLPASLCDLWPACEINSPIVQEIQGCPTTFPCKCGKTYCKLAFCVAGFERRVLDIALGVNSARSRNLAKYRGTGGQRYVWSAHCRWWCVVLFRLPGVWQIERLPSKKKFYNKVEHLEILQKWLGWGADMI